jgi:sulfatase maturation enzyme AslB (radical SAM superfamily)
MSHLRYRDVYPLQSHFSGRSILYDLERTFVYRIPYAFGSQLKSWPPAGDLAVEAQQWLIETGLITDSKKPNWAEGCSDDNPAVTDISLDLSGACNMGCQYCFENPINSRIGKMSDNLTTNATLVTSNIARFLARHHFNVRVSFDGPKEIHNRFRPRI